jgi:hypothetical protein
MYLALPNHMNLKKYKENTNDEANIDELKGEINKDFKMILETKC